MKSFKATNKLVKTIKPAYYIYEAIFSFLLSRIIYEWFLLSKFQSQSSSLYEFLWFKSGYIAAIFIFLWISDWQKSGIELLHNSRDSKIPYSSKGLIYSVQLLFFLLSIGLLTLILSQINIISYNQEFDISTVVLEAINQVSNNQNYYATVD